MFPEILRTAGFAGLSLLLWPILIGITLVNEVIRGFLSIILLFSRYRLLKQGTDSMMWSSQISSKMVLVGLFSPARANLAKDVETFRAAFSRKLHKGSETLAYTKLKKILCVKFGYGCTLDQDHKFRVENHVKLFRQRGDELSETDFTQKILPGLLENMDETKPQWEWIIFPRIRRSNGELNSLRVFRWDHGFMDGASAGIFLAENIFDQNLKPEFFIDPRKTATLPVLHYLAKSWAYFNLPLILLHGILSVLFRSEDAKTPFSVPSYGKSSHTFAGPEHLDLNLIKAASKAVDSNVLSLLLNSYGPMLYQFRPENPNGIEPTSLDVSLMQAVVPYPDLQPRNQFSSGIANVPFSDNLTSQIARVDPDMTIYFGQVYFNWLGRLPIPLMETFLSVGEVSVSLNNIPFLRRKGKINGNLIEEVTGWAMLCVPLGVDVLATSYGDKISLTMHSVDDCLSSRQLQTFLQNFKVNITTLAKSYLEAQRHILTNTI